jgi:hypothetical protein
MMINKLKRNIPKSIKTPLRFVWVGFLGLVNKTSPELATKILHKINTGKWPDLKSPQDFNEKLQWLKLNETHILKAQCSDKYEVYEYVKERSGESILNGLIAVYENANEVNWEALPARFAMKCTHGCGYNVVTKNKSELDKGKVLLKLSKWLKEDFGKRSLEYHYSLIKPRIIVEEYIENKVGELPLDYKIYCFHGVPKLVLVCSERNSDIKLDFFDLDWNRLDIGFKSNESTGCITKPTCFEKMVQHAESLSTPFAFVRVDFYDKDEMPVFGELTFTPAGNMADYYNEKGLKWLGELLDISNVALNR